MSNIIQFPKRKEVAAVPASAAAPAQVSHATAFLAGLIRFVWVAVVLVWPVLKWIVSIEVFFQLIRMMYHWNTPGIYAGWTFLLHFAGLTVLTYFVSIYRPKGL